MVCANGIFWNAASAVTHIYLGHVIWSMAVLLICGALLGGYLGASVGIAKGSAWLRKVFLVASTGTALLLFF